MAWTKGDSEQSALSLHVALDRAARRHHETMRLYGDKAHRYLTFEYCQAEACVEARRALGLPVHPVIQFAATVVSPGFESSNPGTRASRRTRQPGEEG
jgi:hypothetical protein